MIRFIFSLSLLLTASIGSAASSDATAPVNVFDFTGLEIGQSYPFAKVHAHIEGRNVTDRALKIERVVASGPVIYSVKFEPVEVKKGESFSLDLDVTLDATVGRFSHHFDVYAEGKTKPIEGFSVQGFADWLMLPSISTTEFGIFESGRKVVKVVPVETRPGVAIKLVGAEKLSAYIDAQVIDDGKALKLTSRSDAPWSAFDEKLLVTTDNAQQPKVVFHFRGQSRGFVVPALDPLDFGFLREGQSAEMTNVLTDVTGKALKVGKVVAKSRASVITKVTECAVPTPSCKNLVVSYPPMNMLGVTGGMLEVELPDYDRILYIRFGALGIGKDTQIRDLAEDMKAQANRQESISTVLQTSVAQPAIKPQPAQMKTPEGTGPLLKWQVANEYDIYGYEIYRSDSEKGEYQRVSEKIIERLGGDPEAGSNYQWRDNSALAGKTYWYYINIVFNKGKKQQFTSPQKVVAK